MKKLIVLLLSLALTLALAACSVGQPGTTGPKTTDSQPNVEAPTEPAGPSDPCGGVEETPEDPNLSEYEKAFYALFNAGQQVKIPLEDIELTVSVNAEENLLLVCLGRSIDFEEVPTLDGACEGNFGIQFQMLYQSALVAGNDNTVTSLLRENKMFLKLSGDFTDEIAQKHLEYMNTQDITQEQKDALAAALAGESVEGYNVLGADIGIGFSAKVDGGVYTDIRVDCYDGEEIECYFLVLEDAIHQVMEYGEQKEIVAYDFDGNILYEERTDGEVTMRRCYIYNEAGQLVREEAYVNGQLQPERVEYTYDEAGNLAGKFGYRNDMLVAKILYDADGKVITNLEYDEEGNPYWGVETILDAAGKPVEKIQYHGGKEKDVIRYDANGRESSVTSYDYTGQISRTREYTYDEVGNKVQEYTCYADGRTCLETYNSNGDLIKMVNDEGDWRWEHTYDDRGNELSYYRYRQDVLVEWNVYTYNDANKMTSAVYYGENYNGEIGFDSKHLYFYDEKNLMIRLESYYEENGQVPDNVETYTYDANGNMLNSYTYEKDGSLRWWEEHSYDAAGRHLSHITYRGEGTSVVERREVWKYDAQGDCIENLVYGMDGEIAMGFVNEYDENGKLVSVSEYTQDVYRVTQYVDETYSTCHAYDRQSNQLMYWVETFWDDGYIVEEIYHYPE